MRDVVELLRDYSSRSVKADKTGAVTHRGDHEEELAVPPIEPLRSVLDELAPVQETLSASGEKEGTRASRMPPLGLAQRRALG